MIGQINLIKQIDGFNIDTFPKSSVFIGPKGCGKHTLIDHLAAKWNLPVVDMTEDIDLTYIASIYLNPTPTIYTIDMFMVDESKQNKLLKLVEEPVNGSYIMFICENENQMLTTLYSRCVPFKFDPYTEEELTSFIKDSTNKDTILKAAKTPGQILDLNLDSLSSLFNLCHTISSKMNGANFANAFVAADKINYKDEYDKFDVDVFFNVLSYVLFEDYLASNNPTILRVYLLTKEYHYRSSFKRLNLRALMDNYIIYIWEEMNGTK